MTRGTISAEGQRSAFNVRAIDALGVRLEGLAIDSRKVKPGDLFLAYPGQRADGRAHIAQAIAAGATAVLWESGGFQWNAAWRAPNLGVADLRLSVGDIASHFFGNPSRDLWLAGVTGTNGKTSCSHWIAQSLTRLGRRTAVIGTLGSGFPGKLDDTVNTTPDALSLQSTLAGLRANGATGCAMEVSSHGIDQGRVDPAQRGVVVCGVRCARSPAADALGQHPCDPHVHRMDAARRGERGIELAERHREHVAKRALEPAYDVAARPRVLGDRIRDERVRELEQRRAPAADEHRDVTREPPRHRARTVDAMARLADLAG